jgi:hypothetical protein
MANSPTWVREIRCKINGPDAQGSIDVFVFVESPDFAPAQRWHYKQCPADTPLVEWLSNNIAGHLKWEWRTP